MEETGGILEGLVTGEPDAPDAPIIEQQPEFFASTVALDETVITDAMQRFDNAVLMMVILQGLIIGLLCAAILRRG